MISIPAQSTRCQFGNATRDITPPLDIYARWWGAAQYDQRVGVHKPLLTSVAVLAPIEGNNDPLVLVAIDNCVFATPDERALRAAIRERAGLPEANLLLTSSHSHSSAKLDTSAQDLPGGDLVQPYLDELARAIGDAIQEARRKLEPVWITWGTGRCTLARPRDFWDETAQQFVCGFDPDGQADETLLVGRVTSDDGAVRSVLFNYACHPTTLAWENNLFSSDYIGAARETISSIYEVPALFMQGASGELGPREGFVGDPAVADRNGRQLGYAVASTLESLQPPATTFVYKGIRKSGADLGTWANEPLDPSLIAEAAILRATMTTVSLPLKADLPPIADLQQQLANSQDRVDQERLRRAIGKRLAVGEGVASDMTLWSWRLGDALAIAIPAEAYSILQTSLRNAFPDTPLLVLGVTNGSAGYLPPHDRYGDETLYQVWQTPYAAGALETVMTTSENQLRALRQNEGA